MLEKKIDKLINSYHKKVFGEKLYGSKILALDVFNIKIEFYLKNNKKATIENVSSNHLNILTEFKNHLNKKSRDLFCPYPWNDKEKLRQAFLSTIENSKNKIDASFLIKSNNTPIGHFFLWKASNNLHSQRYDVQIPELGIAISDSYQGQGLGLLAIDFLQVIAHYLKVDAIELTTAMSNDGGWYVYKKMNFEYTGDIMNPLEVDVTEEINKEQSNTKYRSERQMVYIINKEKKEKILKYLSIKRNKFKK